MPEATMTESGQQVNSSCPEMSISQRGGAATRNRTTVISNQSRRFVEPEGY